SFLSCMSVPSRRILPCWISSSRLTVRISVDLPDPDGPHTTTTSPFLTSCEISTSAWYLPYHLLTLQNEIIDFALSHWGDAGPAPGDAPVNKLGALREREAHDEVDDRQCCEDLERPRQQRRVDLVGRVRQLVHADHIADRGLLDRGNELADEARQHVVERLRQEDLPHRQSIAQAKRTRRFGLTLGHGFQTRADDFRHVRGLVDHQRDDERRECAHGLAD